MADIRKPPVDAVVVGMGWTGSIMSMELAEAGLRVVGLERGEQRDTDPDFAYPRIADELTYVQRNRLMQSLSRETVTIRRNARETALPLRQYGPFLFGDGVGGSGVHWNGFSYRAPEAELRLRSHYEARYGKAFIPELMSIQDWPVSAAELEPFYDRFEYMAGTSGKAGNLRGRLVEGGNPFEAPRARDYALPPLASAYPSQLFERASRELGLHPYPTPASIASKAYTNPYGMQMGPCNFCGYCELFGCYLYSKASPQACILPALMKQPDFELRDRSQVVKVTLDSTGRKATGVIYMDAQGRSVEQPAELVVLCAYQMHNVRLLLLSGIGQPYDPLSGKGAVGRNYAYQRNSKIQSFFGDEVMINPFIGSGSGGIVYDDYNADNFDHGPLGFVGGAITFATVTGGRPIAQALTPPGTPKWGSGWKKAVKDHYLHAFAISTQGSVMSYRDNYLDLDPTYKDAYGLPLLRMTFDWKDNEGHMTQFVSAKAAEVARAMNPKPHTVAVNAGKPGERFDMGPYHSTHTTGGAVLGDRPDNSVVNKYLQSWDVPNVFVIGASMFPQNFGINPTATLGAMSYFSAKAIRETYLKQPGPLVHA
ncbi:GMC family oxidoreductase [Burkholderia gladioli]|uniref:GMC family oxidoreductase n=1 Tax=Burkholderia gladioli TaxID=28095 RepID=UPI00163FE057|nr:GMC family oxidoreductase [Burkholderia gladioli]